MAAFENTFEVDREKRVVVFAGVKFSNFFYFSSAKNVLSSFNIYGHPKVANKEFTEKYGITPLNFKRVFNKIMNNLWVEPKKEFVFRYCFRSSRLSAPELRNLWGVIDLVEQCERDGNRHLIPWVLKFNQTPEGLKSLFGKALWKKLCKQSESRNKILSRRIRMFSYSQEHLKKTLSLAVTFPSCVLKGSRAVGWDSHGAWAVDQNLHKSLSGFDLSRAQHLRRDTEMMAIDLGKTFNPKWDFTKVKEKHEEFVHLTNLKRYSRDPFPIVEDVLVQEAQYKEYSAKLLTSPYDIHQEGGNMRHCVGSYAGSVGRGEYLVYSIVTGGKRSSTLGVRISDGSNGKQYKLSQHYGHCNSIVTNRDEAMLAEIVIRDLNKNEKTHPTIPQNA